MLSFPLWLISPVDAGAVLIAAPGTMHSTSARSSSSSTARVRLHRFRLSCLPLRAIMARLIWYKGSKLRPMNTLYRREIPKPGGAPDSSRSNSRPSGQRNRPRAFEETCSGGYGLEPLHKRPRLGQSPLSSPDDLATGNVSAYFSTLSKGSPFVNPLKATRFPELLSSASEVPEYSNVENLVRPSLAKGNKAIPTPASPTSAKPQRADQSDLGTLTQKAGDARQAERITHALPASCRPHQITAVEANKTSLAIEELFPTSMKSHDVPASESKRRHVEGAGAVTKDTSSSRLLNKSSTSRMLKGITTVSPTSISEILESEEHDSFALRSLKYHILPPGSNYSISLGDTGITVWDRKAMLSDGHLWGPIPWNEISRPIAGKGDSLRVLMNVSESKDRRSHLMCLVFKSRTHLDRFTTVLKKKRDNLAVPCYDEYVILSPLADAK